MKLNTVHLALIATALATPVSAQTYASMKGNAANGAKLFLQCKACHTLTPGKNMVGPSLAKVIGRTAGSVPGYNYSAANKKSGIVWTEAKLFEYLAGPKKTVPGTKMAFAGFPDPQKRADVIAYIKANGGA
ncbi:c-type cytochrome [Sandaracinobacteroides saxicola]|uniref:Cytochrome c family protein n=1 Tax=Sandaracinobacteroides saxicola TaxID=2759707 RepID=A0A7G5IKU8_9SPHN|nr:cytochrome c family protein [Sandaracinobacteroides saxicola]QMW23990.1 cytochrome c family protein [Sandaracinobacteroides saxicola]